MQQNADFEGRAFGGLAFQGLGELESVCVLSLGGPDPLIDVNGKEGEGEGKERVGLGGEGGFAAIYLLNVMGRWLAGERGERRKWEGCGDSRASVLVRVCGAQIL